MRWCEGPRPSHDEGRARRHVVRGRRRRCAPELPRRREQILLGEVRTSTSRLGRIRIWGEQPELALYSPECAEVDFSHWAARQTCISLGSLDAPETFCGLLAYTDPQKVPEAFTDRNHPLLVRTSRRTRHSATTTAIRARQPCSRSHG